MLISFLLLFSLTTRDKPTYKQNILDGVIVVEISDHSMLVHGFGEIARQYITVCEGKEEHHHGERIGNCSLYSGKERKKEDFPQVPQAWGQAYNLWPLNNI